MGRQLLNNKRVSLMKKDLRLQIKIVHHCLARRQRECTHPQKVLFSDKELIFTCQDENVGISYLYRNNVE